MPGVPFSISSNVMSGEDEDSSCWFCSHRLKGKNPDEPKKADLYKSHELIAFAKFLLFVVVNTT